MWIYIQPEMMDFFCNARCRFDALLSSATCNLLEEKLVLEAHHDELDVRHNASDGAPEHARSAGLDRVHAHEAAAEAEHGVGIEHEDNGDDEQDEDVLGHVTGESLAVGVAEAPQEERDGDALLEASLPVVDCESGAGYAVDGHAERGGELACEECAEHLCANVEESLNRAHFTAEHFVEGDPAVDVAAGENAADDDEADAPAPDGRTAGRSHHDEEKARNCFGRDLDDLCGFLEAHEAGADVHVLPAHFLVVLRVCCYSRRKVGMYERQ